MQYRSGAKINAAWECNLLVVASAHLVLCQVRSAPAARLHSSTLWARILAAVAAPQGAW